MLIFVTLAIALAYLHRTVVDASPQLLLNVMVFVKLLNNIGLMSSPPHSVPFQHGKSGFWIVKQTMLQPILETTLISIRAVWLASWQR